MLCLVFNKIRYSAYISINRSWMMYASKGLDKDNC